MQELQSWFNLPVDNLKLCCPRAIAFVNSVSLNSVIRTVAKDDVVVRRLKQIRLFVFLVKQMVQIQTGLRWISFCSVA